MNEIVRVTSRGHGVWGRPLDVELATSTRTRLADDGVRSHDSIQYFINTSDVAIGFRSFRTEAERTSFLGAAFTDLQLTPLDPVEERTRVHPMNALVGSRYVGVSFLHDHVLLAFDDGTIHMEVWPRVRRGGVVLRRATPGYADALIELIGVRLAAVDEILDLGLVLVFENQTRVTVPLDGTELHGAEVADFTGTHGGGMIWRPGDEDVAWLPELTS